MNRDMVRCFVLAALALLSLPAHSYMGPGAGLSMLGSVAAVLGAVVLALLGVLVLPIRMLLKRRRKAEPER